MSELYDPWATPKRPSSAGKAPALRDPADRDDPDRPVMTQDLIPRHGRTKAPKIWWPDGSRMSYYGRPSGWGEDADNGDRLKAWESRMIVNGYLNTGQQGRTLAARRSLIDPDDKAALDLIDQEAKRLVFDADILGTMKHSMTEKYDLGIPFTPTEEYEYVITEWVRLTRYFTIVDLPDGRPGVECFIAFDEQRRDPATFEPLFDADGEPIMVRLAGTFDRLVEYIPCTNCGAKNYILDLKTSGLKSLPFAQRKTGIQLGIYGHGKLYVPWADGLGATRTDLPDVCRCRGIIVSIPPDGEGTVKWVNIARGYRRAVTLIPQIKEHQKEQDWSKGFTPVPNLHLLLRRAHTEAEVKALFHQYPGEHWAADDNLLTRLASARINEIGAAR